MEKFGFMGLIQGKTKADCFSADALCYSHALKAWVGKEDYERNGGACYPAMYPCRSLKAAKRHLRKHNEIPVGTVFILISWFSGGDIYLVKGNNK